MRFRLLARRITLAPALALALALAVAACSSSSSSSAATSASSAPAASSAASSAAPSTGSTSAAVAQITTNWEKFFNASTPVAEKVSLLQNGNVFAPAINALVKFPLASGLGAKVTAVVVNSPAKATVSYNLSVGLADAPGQPDRGVGLPRRYLEGRRCQPLRPLQTGARRHGASRVQLGRLRQERSDGQPGGSSLR